MAEGLSSRRRLARLRWHVGRQPLEVHDTPNVFVCEAPCRLSVAQRPAVVHDVRAGGRRRRNFSIQPLAASFGAVVTGLDPTEVSSGAAEELRAVFHKFKAIFIHASPGLSPDNLVEFSRVFGEPNIYPRAGFEPKAGHNPHALRIVQRKDATTVPFGAAGWHTDTSYINTPPVGGFISFPSPCQYALSVLLPTLLVTTPRCC